MLGLDIYLLSFGFISISSGQMVAVIAIAVLTAVNYSGVRSGSTVQNIFTVIKIAAIAVLMIAGLIAFSSGNTNSVNHIVNEPQMPVNIISAFGVALIAVLWTFDGWYNVNPVASEIKNPGRNLPLSLIIGIIVLGVIYILVNLFYLQALPIAEMVGVVRIGEKATTAMLGEMSGFIMTALILVSIFGCLSATILPGPRIYYAMSRDGIFFKSFANVHPKYRSPSTAIVWQGIVSALLCLTGTYEQLYTYVIFSSLLFYIALAIALFILRIKMPDANRPYKVWGYPVVPVLFGLSMFLITINTLVERPVESLVGILLVIIGWPVYYYWQIRSTKQ